MIKLKNKYQSKIFAKVKKAIKRIQIKSNRKKNKRGWNCKKKSIQKIISDYINNY
jgi:hypothetical protein